MSAASLLIHMYGLEVFRVHQVVTSENTAKLFFVICSFIIEVIKLRNMIRQLLNFLLLLLRLLRAEQYRYYKLFEFHTIVLLCIIEATKY